MIINKKVIANLRPCKDRFDNYLKFYANKNHTLAQFMGLRNITHADKLWVALRIMPKDTLSLAAADIAESVLHIYEKAYPNDLRPRQAIEAARSEDIDLARAAAHAATDAYVDSAYDDTAHEAATYSAYAAANAAAYAAHVNAHVAYAHVDLAHAAANAAANAADNRNEQEKLIRKICLKYLK